MRVSLDDPGDDVTLMARVLAIGVVMLGIAQPLHDHLLGGHRGDPTEVGRCLVRFWLPWARELDLDLAGAEVGYGKRVSDAVDVQARRRVIGRDDSSGQALLTLRHRDQASDRASPVPRFGQGAVDAG